MNKEDIHILEVDKESYLLKITSKGIGGSRDRKWWCANCPDLDCSGFGESKDEAIKNVVLPIRSTVYNRNKLKENKNIMSTEDAYQISYVPTEGEAITNHFPKTGQKKDWAITAILNPNRLYPSYHTFIIKAETLGRAEAILKSHHRFAQTKSYKLIEGDFGEVAVDINR